MCGNTLGCAQNSVSGHRRIHVYRTVGYKKNPKKPAQLSLKNDFQAQSSRSSGHILHSHWSLGTLVEMTARVQSTSKHNVLLFKLASALQQAPTDIQGPVPPTRSPRWALQTIRRLQTCVMRLKRNGLHEKKTALTSFKDDHPIWNHKQWLVA